MFDEIGAIHVENEVAVHYFHDMCYVVEFIVNKIIIEMNTLIISLDREL